MRRLTVCLLVMVLSFLAVLPVAADPELDRGPEVPKLRVFVHYPRHGKPAPAPGVCDPTTNDAVTDYGLTGWKLVGTVTYRVNYNSIPTSVADAKMAISNSFQVWAGEAAGKVQFIEGPAATAKVAKRDGINLVAWGPVSAANAIAVTYTWYYASTGQVVEQDTIMNVKLPWAYTSVSNPDAVCGNLYAYDVQNILTHEIGHWVGLDDLYEDRQQDLTMYGYGDKGELKKDTLGAGDKLGMDALY